MRKTILFLTVMSLMLTASSVPTEGEGFDSTLRWVKVQSKLIPWPAKGAANKLAAYRHLGSVDPEFILFQFNRSDMYRLKDWKLEAGSGGNYTPFTGNRMDLELTTPAGPKRRVAFEVYEPGDEEHLSSGIDREQWKLRNPFVQWFKLATTEFIIIDADVNGYWFDFGVDKIAVLSADDFSKGSFDPAAVKFSSWEQVIETAASRYTLFTGDPGGLVQMCELPDTFTPDHGRALAYLNWVRFSVGSPSVLPDPELSGKLTKHTEYCSRGTVAREQDPKSVNFDGSVAKVARYAYITPASSAWAGMRTALATLHPRTMLLSDRLKQYGFAFENRFFCVGGNKAAWDAPFSTYPVDGQIGVQLRSMPEEFSPLRENESSYGGLVLTAGRIPKGAAVVEAHLTELRSGKELKVTTTAPADISNPAAEKEWPGNRGGITVIAEEPFAPATLYKVLIKYTPAPGKDPVEVEWLFRTEESGIR